MDLGSHLLRPARFYFGEPQSLYSQHFQFWDDFQVLSYSPEARSLAYYTLTSVRRRWQPVSVLVYALMIGSLAPTEAMDT